MDTRLREEIARRAHDGRLPTTVKHIKQRLKALGYGLDRSLDAYSSNRYMTGPFAGESYPAINTGVKELDTGKSFANVEARRDANFLALQATRRNEELFAVIRGCILEF